MLRCARLRTRLLCLSAPVISSWLYKSIWKIKLLQTIDCLYKFPHSCCCDLDVLCPATRPPINSFTQWVPAPCISFRDAVPPLRTPVACLPIPISKVSQFLELPSSTKHLLLSLFTQLRNLQSFTYLLLHVINRIISP